MLTRRKRLESGDGTSPINKHTSHGGFTVYCMKRPNGKCINGAVQTRTPYSDILLILSCKAHLWFFKPEAMDAT